MTFRFIAVVLALMSPWPAAAQAWQVYDYKDAGFAVQFPAPPKVTQGDYLNTSGALIPATLYSLKQEKLVLTVMVADYSKAAGGQDPVADAVRTASLAG